MPISIVIKGRVFKILKQVCSKKVIFAKTFTFEVARLYWVKIKDKRSSNWPIRLYKSPLTSLNSLQLKKAINFVSTLPDDDVLQAGYEIANQYMILLPSDFRQKYGVFFTPLTVVEKMLDDVEKKGLNFHKAKIIDPAAGGAAFLAPLCRRMMRYDLLDPNTILKDLLERLKGLEIDPFSAWLAQFIIDCELAVGFAITSRPPPIVECVDALFIGTEHFGLYDLVIGNPPYGKVAADKKLKSRYSEVLYGTPNLYQFFYSLALSLVKTGGLVQLITPTSFIGGEYFKRLREMLEKCACPLRFDFFESRSHIFEGVLQELVIAIFRKGQPFTSAPIYQVRKDIEKLLIERIGKCIIQGNTLWVLPKSKSEAILSKLYKIEGETLETLGFKVKTGYVVPHRSSELLGDQKQGSRSFPIIWSDAINNNDFTPERAFSRGKARWYYLPKGECAGLINERVVIIKRISSKEQPRRIHSTVIPSSYLKKFKGFLVENHVNVLYASDKHAIDLMAVHKLLSTQLVDLLFRGISGSVTVSATELRRLPMPSKESFMKFSHLVKHASAKDDIENAAWQAYGVTR